MIRGGHWRGAVVPVAFLVLAEIYAWAINLDSDAVARPTAIFAAGIEAFADGTIPRVTFDTLVMAGAGLGIGGMIGLTGGILLGLFSGANRVASLSVEVLRPIPAVALIPVAMLVYGFGYRMEIFIVAFACQWPVLIYTRSAIAGIDFRLLEVARLLGLSFQALVFKIVLPAALPRIFVAFRLALALALIVAVTVEVAANPRGIGYTMMIAQQSLRPDLMFAMLLWLGVLGGTLNFLTQWAQRHFFGRAAIVEAQP